MEIDAIDESIPSRQIEAPAWETWGKVIANATLIFATCAFVSTAFKKKKPLIADPLSNVAYEPAVVVAEEVPSYRPEDKDKVAKIIQTVAEGGINLAYPPVFRELYRLKREIAPQENPMHPFEFLMAAPKAHMQTILKSKSSFKIKGVIEGIKEGMLRELDRNGLNRHIPDFAEKMGKDPKPIKRLIASRDWIGLVNYLFDTNAVFED